MNPEDLLKLLSKYGVVMVANNMYHYFMNREKNKIELGISGIEQAIKPEHLNKEPESQSINLPEVAATSDELVVEIKRELKKQLKIKQSEPEPPKEDPAPIVERIIYKMRAGSSFTELLIDFQKLDKQYQKELSKSFPESFIEDAKNLRKCLNLFLRHKK